MGSIRTILAALIVSLAFLPAVAAAQQPIDPPMPPDRCFDCWWPSLSVAHLDRFNAQLEVTDGLLVSRYRLELSNSSAGLAEGRLIVPVPPGSSVTDLLLSGGPEALEGRLMGATEAVQLYDDIVARLIDPALLRSLGDDLYEVRAFPVPAGEERAVSFTVTSPLVALDEQVLAEIPWARMSPRPAAAAVTIDIDVPWEARSILAPGLNLDVDRHGDGELTASWVSGDNWNPAASFRAYVAGGEGLVTTRALTYRETGDDGFFALLFAPALEVDEAVARDIVLVLDTSGSMEGEKVEQARDAAAYVLNRLGADDRFAVVSFARRVNVYGNGLTDASEANDALGFVRNLHASGGTNIAGALETAFELLPGDRSATVIFLTDGLPTVGVQDAAAILELAQSEAPHRAQLFAFGVGYDVDTVLLDSLATRFVGTSHYVTPDERIDTEVGRLYERISTPVLTDLRIEIDGGQVTAIAPHELGGLFAGQQALLTGRYSNPGSMLVTVAGNSSAGPERFEYEVTLPVRSTAEPAVGQVWAQRRVADLLTEARIEGPRDSLIEEIVELATQFGIVTPYTSYLAEEPQLALDADFAANRMRAESASAPTSGMDAVAGASDLEALRDGSFSGGAVETVRQLGAHSYYWIDGAWVRDGYQPDLAIESITIGSAQFAALIEAAPELAAAAALGQRVIVPGPDGWVELTWPDLDAAGTIVPLNVTPTSTLVSSGTPVVTTTSQSNEPGGRTASVGSTGFDATLWLTLAASAVALLLGAAAATRVTRGRRSLSGG